MDLTDRITNILRNFQAERTLKSLRLARAEIEKQCIKNDGLYYVGLHGPVKKGWFAESIYPELLDLMKERIEGARKALSYVNRPDLESELKTYETFVEENSSVENYLSMKLRSPLSAQEQDHLARGKATKEWIRVTDKLAEGKASTEDITQLTAILRGFQDYSR